MHRNSDPNAFGPPIRQFQTTCIQKQFSPECYIKIAFSAAYAALLPVNATASCGWKFWVPRCCCKRAVHCLLKCVPGAYGGGWKENLPFLRYSKKVERERGGPPWDIFFFAKRIFFSAARRRRKFLGFGGPKMRLPTLEIAHLSSQMAKFFACQRFFPL